MTSGKSQGLVISDSDLYSINTMYEGKYHPTIGTFGMHGNKSFEGLWSYNPNKKSTWSY
jgi:hypothetical protein